MQYKVIDSIQELKEACLSQKGDYVDFRISLAGGIAYSSKRILYDSNDNTFSVINEIDESFQDNLSENELRNTTMIVEAIEKKSFFQTIF